jgi:hypothetical protein
MSGLRDSFRLSALVLAAPIILLLIAGSCSGQQSVTLTFENLSNGEEVLNYYNGGYGNFGPGPGPDYGITFSPDAGVIIAQTNGGSGYFSGNPSGVPIVMTSSGTDVLMNVSGGFVTGLTFWYAGGDLGAVTVYDGPNGTGNILTTVYFSPTGGYCNGSPYYYSCWAEQYVPFSGFAQSVDFYSAAFIDYDDITITLSPPTGPILSVTPSVSASTTTDTPGPIAQTVTITNSGAQGAFGATIQGAGFSICQPGQSPCQGQQTSGTIGGAGSVANLTVSFNSTGMPPGIYTATYTVTPVDDPPPADRPGARSAINIAPRQSAPAQGVYQVMVQGVLIITPAPASGLTFNLTESQPQPTQVITVTEKNGYALPVAASFGLLPGFSGAIADTLVTGITCPNPFPAPCTPETITVQAAQGTLMEGGSAFGAVTLTCTTNPQCEGLPVGVSVAIYAPSPSAVTKVLPDFATGLGFVTDFYVVNSNTTSSAHFSINFYDPSGAPASLYFVAGKTGAMATLSDTIPAGGASFYEAAAMPQSNKFLTGSAVITSDPAITVQALFRREANGLYYETSVPAATGSNEILVPFDGTKFSGNGAQIDTGLAIANLDTSQAASVSCVARDSFGTVIPGAISVGQPLNPLGEWQKVLAPPGRGTFDCTSNTQIAAMGIRALGNGALSSLPVIVPPSSPGGTNVTSVLPIFAAGGTFVTDFYVVNSSASASNITMSFYDQSGNLVPVPFVAGEIGNLTTFTDTIPGGGSGFYEAGTSKDAPLSGSVVITANPAITVQAIFRQEAGGNYYEAAVPAATGSIEVQVPFDATTFSGNGAQIFAGLAIANLDASNVANVTCIARDSTGNVIPNSANAIGVPPLNPLGQWQGYAFSANAPLKGLRGTFDCTSNTQIAAVGIRSLGNDSLSSLPVIVP